MWATILGYLILCGSYVWLLQVVFSIIKVETSKENSNCSYTTENKKNVGYYLRVFNFVWFLCLVFKGRL